MLRVVTVLRFSPLGLRGTSFGSNFRQFEPSGFWLIACGFFGEVYDAVLLLLPGLLLLRVKLFVVVSLECCLSH